MALDKVRAEQMELGANARAAGIARFSQRGGRGLEGARGGGELHQDAGIQSGKKFLDVGLQTAAWRAAAVRRGAGLQDLPHRPVRPGEMAQRRSRRWAIWRRRWTKVAAAG